MPELNSRTVRIFLSSTFRDFGEERDLLVRKVFPGLRAQLRERFVELVDVDLRWGITVEQSECGEVLPICLAEIDRARPFFVGMLGERYGWVPSADAYAQDLLERQGWLEEHRGGKSVTELEVLHGVLNDPVMAGRAFFYFRSPDYAMAKGGDYVADTEDDANRQRDLKARIRKSGFPVVEDYATPEAFAERLQEDLWKVLNEDFPADDVPDAFEREGRKHEAYASPRRRLYLGGERYILALEALIAEGRQRILVEGQSGGGKSALLANWLEGFGKAHPSDLIHVHYTGASADAADPHALVRRLCEGIKRATKSSEEIHGDPQKLMEGLPLWLANASAYAQKEDIRWVIVIDALNGLTDLRDLRWFPDFLPERVQVVISCLPGEVMNALRTKGDWPTLSVEPLTDEERRRLLRTYLGRYNKTLPTNLEDGIFDHPLSANPLFLRTLGEELRLFGVHEELAARLNHYLSSATVDDLFEKVLGRIEGDCGAKAVKDTMEAIWASRAGLAEQEILGIAGLVPATWAPIRHALAEALLESGGRLTFAYDYLRIAISDRYLAGNGQLADEGQSKEALSARRALHTRLAKWFESNAFKGEEGLIDDVRSVQEIPHQWREAKDWERLKECLTTRVMFEAIYAHATSEEHLSYWLDLEREAGADIETDYETAWGKWSLNVSKEETGELASNLQQFLSFAGRYKNFSEWLAKFSLEITKKIHGSDSAFFVRSINQLAMLLQAKGNIDHAEHLFRKSVLIAEQKLGLGHRDTGVQLNNLGLLLYEKGDFLNAEKFLSRSLNIAKLTEGDDACSISINLNNLALTYREQNNYQLAEPLFLKALEIREKILGSQHPSTAISLNNLAAFFLKKGDNETAEFYCQRGLEIREKILGLEHPQTGTSLNDLAAILQSKGDFIHAESLCRRALSIAEKMQGPNHVETGVRLNNLATILEDMGDHKNALKFYQRALQIGKAVLGADHTNVRSTRSNVARVLRSLGHFHDAAELYSEDLEYYEKNPSKFEIGLALSLSNLASVLEAQGQFDHAEALYSRALSITEILHGSDHEDTASCLNNLAGIFESKGEYESALPLYYRALNINEKRLGPDHPMTGTTINNLAWLLQSMGNLADAEQLYRRAYAIADKALGPNHPNATASLSNLSILLQRLGRKSDPHDLLSHGGFLAITRLAKAATLHLASTELTALSFLFGTALATERDAIWGKTIDSLLDDDLRTKIRAAALVSSFDLFGDLIDASNKMPLSADLRKIIGMNSRNDLRSLIEDLGYHVFGGI